LIDPLKIHLTNIVKLTETISSDCLNRSVEEMEMDISHQMMHNLEKKKVKLNMQIAFLCKDKPDQQLAAFSYDFFYTIDDLELHYQLANEKPLFDGLFVSTLLGITYSTIRGILFQQLTESPLKNIILPVINVPDLLKSKN
jgi:hypothetical protein